MPESIAKSAPLMKLANGLERKMMESATSSGVAARFSGVMLAMAYSISGLTLTQSCTTGVFDVSYHGNEAKVHMRSDRRETF